MKKLICAHCDKRYIVYGHTLIPMSNDLRLCSRCFTIDVESNIYEDNETDEDSEDDF